MTFVEAALDPPSGVWSTKEFEFDIEWWESDRWNETLHAQKVWRGLIKLTFLKLNLLIKIRKTKNWKFHGAEYTSTASFRPYVRRPLARGLSSPEHTLLSFTSMNTHAHSFLLFSTLQWPFASRATRALCATVASSTAHTHKRGGVPLIRKPSRRRDWQSKHQTFGITQRRCGRDCVRVPRYLSCKWSVGLPQTRIKLNEEEEAKSTQRKTHNSNMSSGQVCDVVWMCVCVCVCVWCVDVMCVCVMCGCDVWMWCVMCGCDVWIWCVDLMCGCDVWMCDVWMWCVDVWMWCVWMVMRGCVDVCGCKGVCMCKSLCAQVSDEWKFNNQHCSLLTLVHRKESSPRTSSTAPRAAWTQTIASSSTVPRVTPPAARWSETTTSRCPKGRWVL